MAQYDATPLAMAFDALVFDKDGTLLDFAKTWDPAIFAAIRECAVGDLERQNAVAEVLGFDMRARRCKPGAAVVHLSNGRLARLLDPHVCGRGRALMDAISAGAIEHAAAFPEAAEILGWLSEAGVQMAVATNDDEASAKAQLARVGLADAFQGVVLAADSGFGPKPGPSILVAAAGALHASPTRCAMVGDASSDLEAARNAGFAAAILVGPYDAAKDLAPKADFWIRDLRDLLKPAAETRADVVLAAGPPPGEPTEGLEAATRDLDAALADDDPKATIAEVVKKDGAEPPR